MIGRLWRIVPLLLLSLALPTFPYAAEGLLDGMRFIGKNGAKGQPPSADEVLIFRDGLFLSQSCEPYSFAPSEYTAQTDGEHILFTAVTESPSHGQIVWRGVVRGDVAEVNFVWTREHWLWDIRREYRFLGQLARQTSDD